MKGAEKLTKRDRRVADYVLRQVYAIIKRDQETTESLAKSYALRFVQTEDEKEKIGAKEYLVRHEKLEDIKRQLTYIEFDNLADELKEFSDET